VNSPSNNSDRRTGLDHFLERIGNLLTRHPQRSNRRLSRRARVHKRRSLPRSTVLDSNGLDSSAKDRVPLFQPINRRVQLRHNRLRVIRENNHFQIDFYVSHFLLLLGILRRASASKASISIIGSLELPDAQSIITRFRATLATITDNADVVSSQKLHTSCDFFFLNSFCKKVAIHIAFIYSLFTNSAFIDCALKSEMGL
jgi:hypothetical protein